MINVLLNICMRTTYKPMEMAHFCMNRMCVYPGSHTLICVSPHFYACTTKGISPQIKVLHAQSGHQFLFTHVGRTHFSKPAPGSHQPVSHFHESMGRASPLPNILKNLLCFPKNTPAQFYRQYVGVCTWRQTPAKECKHPCISHERKTGLCV